MRVLHLGKFYPPAKGGMETVLASICDKTAGHVANRVLVANNTSTTVEERRGLVDVVRVAALTRIGAVAVCPTMPAHLARESADVIVIHEPNPIGLLSYFLARPAGRLIVWFHSEVIRPSWRYRCFYRPFLQFALNRASKIIVASPTLAQSAQQLRGWESKCVVIPYGIDICPNSDAVERRADEIRSSETRPIVLFVGRLVRYKGADVLLDAMRQIDAVAYLVGDGPQRRALGARAEALGISDRVRFEGEISDDELRALYRACDVFVLPSVTRQEAFGIVQLEAMAAAKPVICTDLGTGVAWVNKHGETGLVVPPGNGEALGGAIAEILANPARATALGQAAASRVRDLFHVDRMIDSTLELYRTIAGSPAAAAGQTQSGRHSFYRLGKRAVDISLAGAGLVASSPVVACPGCVDQDRGWRSDLLFTRARWAAWAPVSGLEVSVDDPRRGSGGRCGAVWGARPARDQDWTSDARNRIGRAAATLEYFSRRHELRRSPSPSARRNRGERHRGGGAPRGGTWVSRLDVRFAPVSPELRRSSLHATSSDVINSATTAFMSGDNRCGSMLASFFYPSGSPSAAHGRHAAASIEPRAVISVVSGFSRTRLQCAQCQTW